MLMVPRTRVAGLTCGDESKSDVFERRGTAKAWALGSMAEQMTTIAPEAGAAAH